jgi:hypothetical protein
MVQLSSTKIVTEYFSMTNNQFIAIFKLLIHSAYCDGEDSMKASPYVAG